MFDEKESYPNLEKDGFSDQDEKQLQKIGLNIEDIEKLKATGGGTSSIVFDIDKGSQPMILKYGLQNDPSENAGREYTFLRLLKKREVRGGKKISPEPYYYNETQDILIREKIDGDVLEEIDNVAVEKIANTLSLVHQPEFKKPGIPFQERKKITQYERLLDQINFLKQWHEKVSGYIIDDEQRSKVLNALEAIFKKAMVVKEYFRESSFSLIHYDVNPGNIIENREKLIIFLDWRQASIGDRAMDIAKLFLKCNFDEAQKDTFFKCYQTNIKDPSIRERTNTYYPLVRISSFLWRLRFLNEDFKKHPEIEQHVNIDIVKQRLEDDYEYIIKESNL